MTEQLTITETSLANLKRTLDSWVYERNLLNEEIETALLNEELTPETSTDIYDALIEGFYAAILEIGGQELLNKIR